MTRTRQRSATRPTPLAAGESARLVLDIFRTFPLSVTPTGAVLVHSTPIGESAETFTRAHEQMELQLITEAASRPNPGAHRTLHPDDYRFFVLGALAADAKAALGEMEHVDGVWITDSREQYDSDHAQDQHR